MKRKKILTVLCSVVLGVSMIFGGCGSSKSSETTSKQSSDSTSEETTIYGQISSIDGNTITIALAEEPQMPEGATEMPEGSTEMPEGSTEMQPQDAPQKPDGSTEMPEGSTEMQPQDAPQKPDGSTEMPEGSTQIPEGSTESGKTGKDDKQMGGMGISLTGEEQKITIDDSTKITIQSGSDSKDGTVDDLAENDIVTVTMNGDTVVSISVGGGMGAGGMQGDGKAADNTSSKDTEATN